MSENTFQTLTAESTPVLETFLGSLFDREVHLEFDSLVKLNDGELKNDGTNGFTAVARTDGTLAFAVLFQPEWIPLSSAAVLGADMDIMDEGAVDLIKELVSRIYENLRDELPAGGNIPDPDFEVIASGQELPSPFFSQTLWKTSADVKLGDQSLWVTVFLTQDSLNAINNMDDTQTADGNIADKRPSEPDLETTPPNPESVDVSSPQFPDFGKEQLLADGNSNFSLLAEVELTLTVELGRRKLPLSEILRLTPGSVIELEKLVGEPLDIYANGRLIAEGEAVVVEEQFGIRITNLVSTKLHSKIAA